MTVVHVCSEQFTTVHIPILTLNCPPLTTIPIHQTAGRLTEGGSLDDGKLWIKVPYTDRATPTKHNMDKFRYTDYNKYTVTCKKKVRYFFIYISLHVLHVMFICPHDTCA